VNATFEWVRLAQRIPVRIKLVDVPDGTILSSGMTATVRIEPKHESEKEAHRVFSGSVRSEAEGTGEQGAQLWEEEKRIGHQTTWRGER
jgi:multidrug resistance efflux pump